MPSANRCKPAPLAQATLAALALLLAQPALSQD